MSDNNPRSAGSGVREQTRDTIRAKAADLASNAKQKVEQQFESKLGTATNGIADVASALRQAGTQLRDQNRSAFAASLISGIADRLDTFGTSFSGRDLDSVLSDVQGLARRNPAAFAGTAAALGFLAVRFLKSSGKTWHRDHEESLAPLDLTPSAPNYTAGSGNTLGWDTPSSPGSGLTGTAEGIRATSPGSRTTSKPPRSGSGSGSEGV